MPYNKKAELTLDTFVCQTIDNCNNSYLSKRNCFALPVDLYTNCPPLQCLRGGREGLNVKGSDNSQQNLVTSCTLVTGN